MKNLSLLTIVISLLLFSLNCKKNVCPPDKKVGDLDLSSSTLSFNPYTGAEKLIFKNANGDELILRAPDGKMVSRDQLCVKELCTEPKIKGNTTCEYFASESIRYLFRDDAQSMLLELLFSSETYQKDTRNFYSIMRVGFSIENYISQASHITDIQFSGDFNPQETVVNNFLVAMDNITLNDKTFTDVFGYEEDPVKYYYTNSQGLVGFQTPDAIWNLDRIE